MKSGADTEGGDRDVLMTKDQLLAHRLDFTTWVDGSGLPFLGAWLASDRPMHTIAGPALAGGTAHHAESPLVAAQLGERFELLGDESELCSSCLAVLDGWLVDADRNRNHLAITTPSYDFLRADAFFAPDLWWELAGSSTSCRIVVVSGALDCTSVEAFHHSLLDQIIDRGAAIACVASHVVHRPAEGVPSH